MKRIRWIIGATAIVAGCVLACGKKTEQKQAGGATQVTDSTAAAVADALTARGFSVVQSRTAPAQRSSTRASLVVYRSGDGGQGGIIYAYSPVDYPDEHVGWHWRFSDAAPDSAALVEINRDGLWDLRVYFGDRTQDFIQGESFSLMGRERRGSEGMTGPSSSPADLWKCFDGDSTTAWRSRADGAFIEVPLPLGLRKGELQIQLAKNDRPDKLYVYQGERKLQTIDLSDGDQRQDFSLDSATREATSLRIEFKSGKADSVAVSELEIR